MILINKGLRWRITSPSRYEQCDAPVAVEYDGKGSWVVRICGTPSLLLATRDAAMSCVANAFNLGMSL